MINTIYCVGRNYTAHAHELGNKVEAEPIIFSKPTSSLITSNHFTLPAFSSEIHFETELVIRISRDGFTVPLEQADDYYDAVAIGLDLTARDLQSRLKQKQLPWLLSKGFRHSAFISQFIDKTRLPEVIPFEMQLNGAVRQKGSSANMIFSFADLIHFISQFIELKQGDVIFTGTPEGVGKLTKHDHIQLSLDDRLTCQLSVC